MIDVELTPEEERLIRLINDFTAEQRAAASEYDDVTLADHLETLDNVYVEFRDGTAQATLALFYLKIYTAEFVKRGCPGETHHAF